MGAEDYPRGKPAPDGYLRAAERLEIAPARTLVFEDSHAGIASGLAAFSFPMFIIASVILLVIETVSFQLPLLDAHHRHGSEPEPDARRPG